MAGFKLPLQKGDGDGNEDIADINVIPLVDIMLVLLVIFMVAAPLSMSGIKVNLPRTPLKGGALDSSRVVLTIDTAGNYYL